jgi:secreted trypsin-like serine protease
VVNLAQDSQCTAAIINDKFVLTAAHCVDYVTSADEMEVYHDQEYSNLYSIQKGTPLKVKNVFKKEYEQNPEMMKNDIALLELEERLVFTDTISPICLTPEIEHDNYFAAGWGLQKAPKWVDDEMDFSNVPTNTDRVLSEIPLKHISDQECLEKSAYKQVDYQICVRGLKEGLIFKKTKSNLCLGDSGGPLMTRGKDGRVSTLGVASTSDCNAVKNKLSIYEKIIAHKKWIEENTKDAVWCQGSSHFFA